MKQNSDFQHLKIQTKPWNRAFPFQKEKIIHEFCSNFININVSAVRCLF